MRGSRAARYLIHAYDLEHGKKRSGYRDFGNRSRLELLATEIDNGPRRSHAKLCALIDVKIPLLFF